MLSTSSPVSKILITGGTGSFGRAFVRTVLKTIPSIERLVVYSRDELKQWEMRQEFPEDEFPQVRFFLGDIRDKDRLCRALDQINTVVHAAALKQVPAAEYEPIEFINTNVIGSENLVQACLDTGVNRVVALSTDKAAAPINLYGATKLCADKLFLAANNIVGSRDLRFSVVRYGNVMGSRGSVIPFFLKKQNDGVLPITDLAMTRFNILLSEGVDMVLWALENAFGGELFVPKIPSYRIVDVAKAVNPDAELKIVGVRPGEKLHEEMITSSDSYSTYDLGKYYSIMADNSSRLDHYHHIGYSPKKVNKNFSYNSRDNDHFLTVEELRQLIHSEILSSMSK